MSFISKKFMDKIGYAPYAKPLNVSGIGSTTTVSNHMIDLTIFSSVYCNRKFNIQCSLLQTITCKLPQVPIDVNKIHIPDNIKLADPSYHRPSEIDLLIGADCYYDLLSEGLIKLGKNLPILLNTHLGWVIAGKVPSFYLYHYNDALSHVSSTSESIFSPVSMIVQCNEQPCLDELLTKFWKLEEISEKIPFTPEDELAENIFTSTTKVLENGSYQVDLPLSSKENLNLGDSLSIAKKRFFNLEKKFEKNSSYFLSYKKFIDEYVELNHGRYVPLSAFNEKSEPKYFLPHHAVIREDSITTKLRVVFDGSCKSSSGLSLNNIMLKGYQVQPNLYDILCRFRSFKFVLTSDIEKMYRQIRINPCQTFLLNILWRESPKECLKCIELLTVTYGTNCAPFLATRVLCEIAQRNKNKFPLASDALLNQTYVDDILSGCDDISEIEMLYKELNSLLNSCGLKLHKWCSNSGNFREKICESNNLEYNMNFDEAYNKVLGLKWNSAADFLCISIPPISFETPVSKRKILSVIAQCYDPLGLLSPVIVIGKLIMQKLWLLKIDWDTKLTDEVLLNEWKILLENLPLLGKLKIPRYLFLNKTSTLIEFHGFCDASQRAYAACVYVRSKYSDGSVSCNLISSKSRVAPLKIISLPRLELCAMLLLSKLVAQLLYIYDKRFSVNSFNLWTDSEIALCWILSHASRWTTFVANRVTQIQELTSNFQWRHVRSIDNPADLPSRGIQPQYIIKCEMWWQGPTFLQSPNIDLSKFENKFKTVNIPEEKKVTTLACRPTIDLASSSLGVKGFYKGKTIFITGGSGFVGICLLEKILRTIPEHGDIYLLMRQKKGKAIHERLEEIKKNSVFESLLKDKSVEQVFSKVKVIAGDVGEENLGLSPTDWKLLTENVNVIFHSAATLDFGDTLDVTVNINLLGTRRVTKLAKECRNLAVLVHVSSAYVNSFRTDAEEIIYPLHKDSDELIAVVNKLSLEELKEETPKLLGDHPNTYTITKHMAEHEIQKCETLFPCTIVRPSMIVGAWKEPVPGWTISKNGPQGFLMGAAKGVIRRLPVGKSLVYDYIPVDIVVNSLIASGFHAGHTKPLKVTVYHATSSTRRPFRWETIENKFNKYLHDWPLKTAVWYPYMKFLPSITWYKISAFFVHFFPAIILDTVTRIVGGRPILMKLHRNVNNSLGMLSKFIFSEWKFFATKTEDLQKWLNGDDQQTFNVGLDGLAWPEYFNDLAMGARVYLNKDPLKTLKVARTKDNILFGVHLIWQAILFSLIWYLFSCITGMTISASVFIVPISFILFSLV